MNAKIFLTLLSIVLLTAAASANAPCPTPLLNKERAIQECQHDCSGAGNEEKNILIVKQAYSDFLKGDMPAAIGWFTENADYIQPGGPEVPLSGKYHGPEQIAWFFNNLLTMVEFTDYELQEFIAKGDQVIVLGHYEGRFRSSGRTFASDLITVFRIDNGKISRCQIYHDTAAIAGVSN
jgi:ketosteroid isomerase-like protein